MKVSVERRRLTLNAENDIYFYYSVTNGLHAKRLETRGQRKFGRYFRRR